MTSYNKDNESSYIMYWDANILYVYLQNYLLGGKNTPKFDEHFIKNYNENSDKGYIIEVEVEYPRRLHKPHNDLPFLPKRMKIKKCHELVCNLSDKNKYITHIRTLKQALNHGLILKKVYKVIKFNQKNMVETLY